MTDDELRAKLLCENHKAGECPHDHGEGPGKSHDDGKKHPVICFACWNLWKLEDNPFAEIDGPTYVPVDQALEQAVSVYGLKHVAAALGYKLVPLEDYPDSPEPAFDALAGKIGLTPEQAKRESELARKIVKSKKLREEMTPEEIKTWAKRLAADSIAIGEADAWAALGYSIPPDTTSLDHALEEGKCVGCNCPPDGWSYICSQCLRPTDNAQAAWDAKVLRALQEDESHENGFKPRGHSPWDLWDEWRKLHADRSCPGSDTCATVVHEEGSEIRNRCVFCTHEVAGIQSMTCGDCRSPK